jgi:hypothetical protein
VEQQNCVADVLIWLSQYGGWGVVVVAIILFIIFYDKAEKPIARILDLFLGLEGVGEGEL